MEKFIVKKIKGKEGIQVEYFTKLNSGLESISAGHFYNKNELDNEIKNVLVSKTISSRQ